MKAIRFYELGGPEVLRLETVADPVPARGEVLVRVRAVGVNFADTRFSRGEYLLRPQLPAIPGMEAAGEVIALGEGVSAVAVGARVMVVGTNAYAELMTAKAQDLYPIPEGLSFEQAASLPVQGLTAHHVLFLSGRLARGERVLVHAAAGGVGTLAVQLARQHGASMVIATAGSSEKLELARSLGADVAINYRTDDVALRVRQATAGSGVDVLLEMLGGSEALRRNLACLAPFGRMVVYGAASGDVRGAIEPITLMTRNLSVTGYYLTAVLKKRELCAPPLDDLARAVVAGRVKVIISRSFPLSDAAVAHRALEQRSTVGKLVLLP